MFDIPATAVATIYSCIFATKTRPIFCSVMFPSSTANFVLFRFVYAGSSLKLLSCLFPLSPSAAAPLVEDQRIAPNRAHPPNDLQPPVGRSRIVIMSSRPPEQTGWKRKDKSTMQWPITGFQRRAQGCHLVTGWIES